MGYAWLGECQTRLAYFNVRFVNRPLIAGKGRRPRADQPASIRPTGGSRADDTATDEILAVIAAEEPPGATADQVARASGLGLTGEVVQDTLEEVVEQGLLDRRGIGHGAVYTLTAKALCSRGLFLAQVSRRWASRYACSHARVVRRTIRGPAIVVTVLRRPLCTARYSEPEFFSPASLLA